MISTDRKLRAPASTGGVVPWTTLIATLAMIVLLPTALAGGDRAGQQTGACCTLGGLCAESEPEDCTSPDVWQGAGTPCAPNCCAQPSTGADCACDTYQCMTGAECADGRVCSGNAAPCESLMDCPIGDTCDPDWTGVACDIGDGEEGNPACNAAEKCLGHYNGQPCDPANGDADCNPGETCARRCAGPQYLTLPIPGQFGCVNGFAEPTGDPCDPANGDADCVAIDPLYTCEWIPGGPVEYAFSGDSSPALFSRADGDTCNFDHNDPGWHEGFTVINPSGDPYRDCATITADFCCNDPVKIPAYIVLMKDCPDDCTWVVPDVDENGDGRYGFGPDCNAEQCCEDGNLSVSFLVLPGTYSWQIFGAPTCDGTARPCASDDDCDQGVPCLYNLGEYQGHFTMSPYCPAGECCLDQQCVVTSEPICKREGGEWLGPNPIGAHCWTDDACIFGACCLAPGQCLDESEWDTAPECAANGGPGAVFVPGVTCADRPCRACSLAEDEFCKSDDGDGNIIQSNIENNVRVADDFRPTTDTISQLCWTPAFLFDYGDGPTYECSAPGETPPDDWMISIYPDDGTGVPDDENPVVFQAPITVDAKVHHGANSRLWDYAGFFDPVTVIPNECYWLEILGTGSRTCYTYLATAQVTNAHSMYDVANFGDYEPADQRGDDIQFCLDSGITGTLDCGDRYGVCCTCPGVCESGMTGTECEADLGTFILGDTCDPNPCPLEPANNDCVDAEVITLVPVDADTDALDVEFNNICATDDGPESGCGDGDLHFDVWYYFKEQHCAGPLYVSTCNLAAFDTIIALYDGTGGPSVACPVSDLDELDNCNPPWSGNDCCGDDTCMIASGPSEVSIWVNHGREILIRVGGWYDGDQNIGNARGFGTLHFREELTGECWSSAPDPERGGPHCTPIVKYCHGGDDHGTECTSDADCGSGGTCWDDCWDDWSGASCVVTDNVTGEAKCYIPKNRYLTIDPTVNSDPVAYYISLDTTNQLDDQYAACGIIEGFLSDPVCLDSVSGLPVDPQPSPVDPCQGEGLFGWVSYIVDGPVLPRIWQEDPLHVAGCEIVPGATYHFRGSVDGVAPDEPWVALTLMTAHDPTGDAQHWGDVTSSPGVSIPWMPPEYATNLGDVSAVIATFEGSGGPAAHWCDVEIDHTVSLSDVQFLILAFEGATYPELADIVLMDGRPGIGWEPCDCP